MRTRIAVLVLAIGLLAVLPVSTQAQAGATLLGHAYDASNGSSVENGLVSLEGYGSTLTNSDGRFRFRSVTPGTYTLVVEAFGYGLVSREVMLEADLEVEVPLEAAPLPLDSIVVEARSIDFHGRVRDPARDFFIVDAQVLSRGRDPVWTDTHGRFDLDDLPEGVPVSVTIRAFGYLPVDTVFTPDDEERYTFELARDAFAEAMIDMQVRRLDERAGGRLAAFGGGVLDRAQVLDYSGSHTASTMLQFWYPQRILDRIVCTFIDDRATAGSNSPLAGELAEALLGHLIPEEIERVELLEFPGIGRPLMLQVYTRSFVMEMSTRDVPLRNPTITPRGGCL